MKLDEFSNAVREIIRGNPSTQAIEFVKTLQNKTTVKIFGFLLSGKTVKVMSPLRSIPAVTSLMLRAMPSKDYDYSARVQENTQTKVLSKRFASGTDVDKAQKELFFGKTIDRVFYEIVTTEDFEITFSEYEGTVIKTDSEETARRCFQAVLSLFPFAESEKNSKQVRIICEFDIQPYDRYGKEQKRKGSLSCRIEVDGKGIGTKGNNFVF